MNTFLRSFVILLAAFFCFACGKKGDPGLPVTRAPEAPKRFHAAARAEGVILLWKASDKNADGSPLLDLSGFRILRSAMPIEEACLKCPRDYKLLYDYDYRGPNGQAPEKRWFYYQDAALAFKHVYTYTMQCYNEREHAGPPAKAIDVYWDTPPAAPSHFRWERKYRVVSLFWDPPASLADGTAAESLLGYNVYRTLQKGVYRDMPINQAIVPEPAYEDVPDTLDTVYFYTVRAVRAVQDTMIESAPSGEIEVAYMDITPPGAPQGLTVVPTKEGMLLKWIPKGEKDFGGFYIYRKSPGEDRFVRLNEKPVRENAWVDAGARVGRRYIYGVSSVDRSAGANESALSETVEVLYILK